MMGVSGKVGGHHLPETTAVDVTKIFIKFKKTSRGRVGKGRGLSWEAGGTRGSFTLR